MYCAGKTSACQKRRFASSVLHSCNVKTQICVTRPQCAKKSLHGDRCSISRAFFDVTSRDLSTGSLPPDCPHRAQRDRERERDDTLPEPSVTCLTKSPMNEPPLFRFPNGAPMERDVCHQSLFYVSPRVPSSGVLPSSSPCTATIERERERERETDRQREKPFENDKAKRHTNTRAKHLPKFIKKSFLSCLQPTFASSLYYPLSHLSPLFLYSDFCYVKTVN